MEKCQNFEIKTEYRQSESASHGLGPRSLIKSYAIYLWKQINKITAGYYIL